LKGESVEDCLKRLSKEELGQSIKIEDGEFLGFFENIDGDPRGHLLHYISCFRIRDSKAWLSPTKEGKKAFFKKLPKNIISYQREFLNKFGYK